MGRSEGVAATAAGRSNEGSGTRHRKRGRRQRCMTGGLRRTRRCTLSAYHAALRLRVDQNAASLMTGPEMRFCGHKDHPNVIEHFPTRGSIETISSFISIGSHNARQRAYLTNVEPCIKQSNEPSCGRKPEVSHEASDHICNCGRCRSHYCNNHVVIVFTFDRALCRRYSHRSLQEFPQLGRDKSFRAIALLSAKNVVTAG